MRRKACVQAAIVLTVCGAVSWQVGAGDLDADWGGRGGSAPFASAFLGDMPYDQDIFEFFCENEKDRDHILNARPGQWKASSPTSSGCSSWLVLQEETKAPGEPFPSKAC